MVEVVTVAQQQEHQALQTPEAEAVAPVVTLLLVPEMVAQV